MPCDLRVIFYLLLKRALAMFMLLLHRVYYSLRPTIGHRMFLIPAQATVYDYHSHCRVLYVREFIFTHRDALGLSCLLIEDTNTRYLMSGVRHQGTSFISSASRNKTGQNLITSVFDSYMISTLFPFQKIDTSSRLPKINVFILGRGSISL